MQLKFELVFPKAKPDGTILTRVVYVGSDSRGHTGEEVRSRPGKGQTPGKCSQPGPSGIRRNKVNLRTSPSRGKGARLFHSSA